ncbi:MAG: hypothetical protein WCO25_03855 [Candidatus Uhrbacteria bacterium]
MLLDGMAIAHIGMYMPKKDKGEFMLGIFEGEGRGDILISERVLKCPDDVLRMMLGHELGHLEDPPERSTTRNDLFLFAWCVFLAFRALFLLTPTTHPPVAQRRELVKKFMEPIVD